VGRGPQNQPGFFVFQDTFAGRPAAPPIRRLSLMDPSVSQTVPEVIRTVELQYYVFFASALFAIGVTGVLVRRNAIIIFMCVELMLNAVNILLTAFSAYRADPNGQIFVFFIMAVAAAEVSVGLGIIVMIYRNFQTTDVNLLSRLKW
jgi:NADH-quinone oxidoreductase subunit K